MDRNSSEEEGWLLSNIILSLKKNCAFLLQNASASISVFAFSSILLWIRKGNLKISDLVLLVESVYIIAIAYT